MSMGRYIVAREWGFGFWSDVDHVLGVLLLAEITGRIPLVHWGDNSLFGRRDGQEAFSRFFKPVSKVSVDGLIGKGLSYYGPEWDDSNLRAPFVPNVGTPALRKSSGEDLLDREENILVSKTHVRVMDFVDRLPQAHTLHGANAKQAYGFLFDKYLIPNAEIASAADDFYAEKLSGNQCIAVHCRGTDKRREVGDLLDQVNDSYFSLLDPLKGRDDWRIFVMTESQTILDQFVEKFGDKIVTTECQRTSGDEGLHYLDEMDGVALGQEVLLDALIATKADRFLGNGASGVSAAVDLMKDWPEGASALVIPNDWITDRGQ